MTDKLSELLSSLPLGVRSILCQRGFDYDKIQEIRIRLNQPLVIYYDNRELVMPAYKPAYKDVNELLEFATKHSLYAFENEIRQGYITVRGGHRVGLCGKAVMKNGQVSTFKNISCANVRVAHEVEGCSREIFPMLHDGNAFYDTLIVSPPGCGKTTVLRDLIRTISNGTGDFCGRSVGVCDERSEIAACFNGEAQNDLGIRTDIVDGCPKEEAMQLLIRAMAPSVLALDEIGTGRDIEALHKLSNCGCNTLATVHGGSVAEIRERGGIDALLEKRVFRRIVVLSRRRGPGTLECVERI